MYISNFIHILQIELNVYLKLADYMVGSLYRPKDARSSIEEDERSTASRHKGLV